jgi:hypothetical protein
VDPTWSPDGSQLAYVKDIGGNAEIFVIDATAGQVGVNITNNAANDWDPAWSSELVPSRRSLGSFQPTGSSLATGMLLLGVPLIGLPIVGRLRKRRSSA